MEQIINNFARVEGYSNLIRDQDTNAIVNLNKSEYQNYKTIKETKEKEIRRIEHLEQDMVEIKDQLSEIKSLIIGAMK